MKALSIDTPVITTFYSKENVFGFISRRPKTMSGLNKGRLVDKTIYYIELIDGSEIIIQDKYVQEVDPNNVPENYELPLFQRMNLEESDESDNEKISCTVAFTSTDKRSEIRIFNGNKKSVNLSISNYAVEHNYNSYSVSTL